MSLREQAKLVKMGLRDKAEYFINNEPSFKRSYINELSDLVQFLHNLEKENQLKLNDYSKSVLNKLDDSFGIEKSAILLKDSVDNLELLESYGFKSESNSKVFLTKENELLKEFYQNPNSMFIDNYINNTEMQKGLDLSSTQFLVLSPLIVFGDFFGVLAMFKIKDDAFFSSSQDKLMFISIISRFISHSLYFLIKNSL